MHGHSEKNKCGFELNMHGMLRKDFALLWTIWNSAPHATLLVQWAMFQKDMDHSREEDIFFFNTHDGSYLFNT